MQFGIQIEPAFGFSFDDVVEIARDAESHGFTGLWVSDHFFLSTDATTTNCLEAWTLLSGLAQHTTTLRLGPMVTAVSYRNPALLAKIAAGGGGVLGGPAAVRSGGGGAEAP